MTMGAYGKSLAVSDGAGILLKQLLRNVTHYCLRIHWTTLQAERQRVDPVWRCGLNAQGVHFLSERHEEFQGYATEF